ncbi:MAG: DUF3810 domain-containing protein [Clostridiaceae bacterium]|nr:DUF3810 domain-containing protein [Eubacteriales bacterium]
MRKRNDQARGAWLRQLKKLPWLILIPLGLYLPDLAAKNPQWIEENFSNGVYPHISGAIAFLTSFIKFSLAEFLLYALVLIVTFSLLSLLIGLIFRKVRVVQFVGFLLSLCVTAGVLLNVFYAVWGLNYARPALSASMNLNVHERPVGELKALSEELAEKAASLRAQVRENEKGVFYLPDGYESAFAEIPAAYEALNGDIHLFLSGATVAKPVYYSEGLSYAGLAGVYFPFTAEPNVNVGQPALLLISSAAHETAHYMGIAREDEANFMAYLACIHSDDPAIAYSGVMLALINCASKLYEADYAAYASLYASYSDGMKRDLADYNVYWDAFEGPVEEAVTEVNDNYLKFNNQENGVKSYGMMVDLLLAYANK